jgi:hypothetical protein
MDKTEKTHTILQPEILKESELALHVCTSIGSDEVSKAGHLMWIGSNCLSDRIGFNDWESQVKLGATRFVNICLKNQQMQQFCSLGHAFFKVKMS